MNDATLIDAMRTNVNYSVRAAVISWRKPGGSKPVTLEDRVEMWSDTDWNLRQIKHRLPKSTNDSNTSRKINTASSNQKPAANPPSRPVTPHFSTTPTLTSTSPPVRDPMDLSAAMVAIKGKRLKTPGVKQICDDWRFCYYRKLSHPGQIAINCPNKGKQTQLNSMDTEDEIEDIVSENA